MAKQRKRLRRMIRYEAARIMAEDGVGDYRIAKRKACSRIGISPKRGIPSNFEIEDGLAEHLAIFSKEKLSEIQRQYLWVAKSVMERLQHYSPRLTGAVLSGNITSTRPVAVQVFANTVEEVSFDLSAEKIKHKIVDRRVRFLKEGYRRVSALEFWQHRIEILVFVFLPGEPYPPLSTTNGKPIKWISRKKVNSLLGSERI